ncbi:MAG: peptidoglycan recognition family protein [Bacteroides sp.]
MRGVFAIWKELIAINITQNFTSVNRTVYTNRSIDYIVIHYFGALGSAKDTCAFFKNVNRRASAHYFVDDYDIWQCVRDKDAAWHCGDSGVGAYKKACSNSNSIGIEVRPRKISTKTLSVTDTDWYFANETIANLTELVRSLMEQYGIDANHVIRHFDVTGKWCPRPWQGNEVNTYYGKTGEEKWQEFKDALKEDDEMLTYEQFKEYMNRYNSELADIPGADWSAADRKWAEDRGIIMGDEAGRKRWKCAMTREEYAATEHRQAIK